MDNNQEASTLLILKQHDDGGRRPLEFKVDITEDDIYEVGKVFRNMLVIAGYSDKTINKILKDIDDE